MRSSLTLCVPFLFAACSTLATPAVEDAGPLAMPASDAVAADAWAGVAVQPAEVAALAAPGAAAPHHDSWAASTGDDYVLTPLRHKKAEGSKSYTKIKLGAFAPAGDLSDFDTGFYGDLVFARDLMVFLAIEGSIGYFQTEGSGIVSGNKVWGIPIFVNGRLKLPVLIFELYGGAGLGGIYADYDFGGGGGSDFVWAWDAFVGAEVGLGKLALGLEYKYIQSDEVDGLFAIEGSVASLYASLPF